VQVSGVNLENLKLSQPTVKVVPPQYTESLLDWLAGFLSASPSEVAGGIPQ
jgi:hypothetical protein